MDGRIFITGGAGFIGSHLTKRLLETTNAKITVYDNFSSGQRWHFGDRATDPRLTIIEAEAQDQKRLIDAVAGHDAVFHFAANPDIARAQREPWIDFNNGTIPANNVLEAMRITGVKRIFFTSGSGVYGELGSKPVAENYDHMIPVSTYGACKLACESLISAYCHMFDLQGTVLRFANVVGPHQTHGVAYDFIRRLAGNPRKLRILGDGNQSKPYVHVYDVLDAFDLVGRVQTVKYDVFNVGSTDFLTVREIADIVCDRMKLRDVEYEFTGGPIGWKGDVPIYRLNTEKVRALGWKNKYGSRQAVEAATEAMVAQLKAGFITPAA
jgi:UDP-glucose 4-epimerase